MLVDTNNIPFTQTLGNLFQKHGVNLFVARLDLLHPVVSGNKLFKLHYFLQEALATSHKTVLTTGGAYSNHLVATAFACDKLGLKSIGIVRGEEASSLSHTLQQCRSYGMQLNFISRSDYKNTQDEKFVEPFHQLYGSFTFIPEGGYHPLGAEGAALIMKDDRLTSATHVCTAVGTATTLAGLIKGSNAKQQIIAVPVLKNLYDLPERILYLTGKTARANLHVLSEYHFGGYAKKTASLLQFMNDVYTDYHISTDFVYTAKMLYGIFEEIKKGYFPKGSTVVCLHTGGLQGNDSLPPGSLNF